jgi:hypothetical protein
MIPSQWSHHCQDYDRVIARPGIETEMKHYNNRSHFLIPLRDVKDDLELLRLYVTIHWTHFHCDCSQTKAELQHIQCRLDVNKL